MSYLLKSILWIVRLKGKPSIALILQIFAYFYHIQASFIRITNRQPYRVVKRRNKVERGTLFKLTASSVRTNKGYLSVPWKYLLYMTKTEWCYWLCLLMLPHIQFAIYLWGQVTIQNKTLRILWEKSIHWIELIFKSFVFNNLNVEW